MQLNSVSNFEDGGEKAAHRVEGVRKVKRLWCRRRHRAPVHKFCDTQASNLLPSEQQVLGEDQQGCQMSSHTKKLTLKGHRKKTYPSVQRKLSCHAKRANTQEVPPRKKHIHVLRRKWLSETSNQTIMRRIVVQQIHLKSKSRYCLYLIEFLLSNVSSPCPSVLPL